MTDCSFATSNLSKITPKLRTSGRISGNFGKNRVKSGSPLRDIGVTDTKVVNLVTQDQYLNRLIEAYHKTDDLKLKKFIYEQIRKIQIQRNVW